MRRIAHAIIAALALFIATPALADGAGDAGPDVAAPPVTTQPAAPEAQPSAAPEGRTGQITLDEVTLNVPQGWKFYSAEEAQRYLQRNNASAPQGVTLGLLAREGDNINAPGTWATVVSFDAIGYVQPETASGLSDANFESEVRAARTQQARAFEGFAAQPAFDANVPNLIWAERSAAPGSQGPDLRYEQKSLGRYGVACLTSIGSADQMPAIEAAAAELRNMLSFPEGRRHADFQPASDQVSAYSVPGLVTGVPTPPPAQAASEPVTTGQTAFGGLAGWFPWVAIGVIVLAIAGYMMMRKRNRDDEEAEA
jgi:uncharacterized membrane-anchored protein